MPSGSSKAPPRAAPIARRRKPVMPRWPVASPLTGRSAARSGVRSRRRWYLLRLSRVRRASDRPLLIDCLTLWLSNLLFAARPVDEEDGSAVHRLTVGRRPGRAGRQRSRNGPRSGDAAWTAIPGCRRPPQPRSRCTRRPRRVCCRRPAADTEGRLSDAPGPDRGHRRFLALAKGASFGICWLAPRDIGIAVVGDEFAELAIDRELQLGCGDVACRRRSASGEQ